MVERQGFAVGRVGVRLAGARAGARPSGESILAGKVNAFLGSDRRRWRTDAPTYGRVRYPDVYPGIDLLLHGTDGRLEYDFVVAPGADPSRIAIAPTGARAIRLDARGNVMLRRGDERLVQRRPTVYQRAGGHRRPVNGRFVLRAGRVHFALGAYDHRLPLVIDPVLTYSTYLGGGSGEQGIDIAVDAQGSAYVVGSTLSPGGTPPPFPTVNAFQGNNGGSYDGFVTKLNPQGNAFVYSTYLGGTAVDVTERVRVDAQGSAYVSGTTASSGSPGGFPTANALQASRAGTQDGFVTKLSPQGNALVYSTYLGGNGVEEASGLAIDAQGNVYVGGRTGSSGATGFPTVNPLQPNNAGGQDAFLAKLNPQGSALIYSTYLGGTGDESVYGLARDGQDNLYATGQTSSNGAGHFPTVNPLQPQNAGMYDAFVTKVNAAGSALAYSTYLGGGDFDSGGGIDVDGQGNAFVSGSTQSSGATGFPTVNAFQPNNAGSEDVFASKLNANGNALVYSTYLGGGSLDFGGSIAVDCAGSAWLAGATASSGTTPFPTASPIQASLNGPQDAYITQLNPAGSALSFSTYLGGGAGDVGSAIAIDGSGNAYVTGLAISSGATGFPTVNPAQPANGGNGDAFVAKIAGNPPNCPTASGGGGSGTGAATTVNQLPVASPPPAPPDGTTTFRRLRVDRKRNLIFTYDVRSAGRMVVVVTGPPSRLAVTARKKKRKKPLAVGRGSATATGPGPLSVTVKPSRRAARLLRKRGRLAVTAVATFTPNGGSATTTRTKATAVAPKVKKKRR
jgi:hypothetical protein